MKRAKQISLLLTTMTLLSGNLEATNHPKDGNGYIELRRTSYITPLIPIGIVILAGAGAALFRNGGHHHHHGHSH